MNTKPEQTLPVERVAVPIPAHLVDELNAIRADGGWSYGKAHESGGVLIDDTVYSEFDGVIEFWEKHYYRWNAAKDGRETFKGLSDQEALEQGLTPGGTIRVANGEWVVQLSLPQSSYRRFAKYVDFLVRKGATPRDLITRIRSTMVKFKMGTQPVLSFEPLAPNKMDANIIDVEATSVTTGPPNQVPPAPVTEEAPESSKSAKHDPWT
jgi:hypothetical protein